MNQRPILIGAGAVSAAALLALFVLTMRDPARPTPSAAAEAPMQPATPSIAPATTSIAPTVTTTASAVPIASVAPSASAFDPEFDDSWKLLAGNAPPGAGDPFEDPEAGEMLGKMLGKVGAIRYGFVREKTTVHNEAAVAAILRRAALDIDKLDRGRTDQPHKRMPEYETILRGLRAELRPHMDGRVMVAGQGWAVTSEAGESAEAAARDAGRE